MKRVARNVIAALVLSFLFISVVQSQLLAKKQKNPSQSPEATQENTPPPQASSMTTWQARRAVVMGLRTATIQWKGTRISSIKVAGDFVEFNIDEATVFGKFGTCWSTGKTQIDLRTLGTLTTRQAKNRGGGYTSYLYMDGTDLTSTVLRMGAFGGICGKHLNILGIFAFGTAQEAQKFVDGMNRLSYFARSGAKTQQEAEWTIFQQKATAWRALSPKPPLPEEVRQQRVLAENSIREKDLDAAIEHYEEGLDIDPVWPEGHFNAALLYAERNQYSDAIWHMRAYLELVPDAPDVQSARDQMVIWQDKTKQ